MTAGVSVVVPVRNGSLWIEETLRSILGQRHSGPLEVIVVNDGGNDGSDEAIARARVRGNVRIIDGPKCGAAAAINAGLVVAKFPIICQIDQDVVLEPDWLQQVLAAFDDPAVGAVQARYVPDGSAGIWARIMALDLDLRYAAIRGAATTHVCTGNVAYRASALRVTGGFDERLGYGYDNDMSYRLIAAGYALRFCRTARSRHHWREGICGYAVQQYGFGYGRLDVVAKHPARVTGDSVSPAGMMAHPALLALAVGAGMMAAILAAADRSWREAAAGSIAIVAGLLTERAVAGIRAASRSGDLTALLFPIVHTVRDVAWVAAMVVWMLRRLARRPARPDHSMRPRRRDRARSDFASSLET